MNYKQIYNTFQNVLFAHKYLLQGRTFPYLVQSSLIILGNIATAFMLTYLPALAIHLLRGSYPSPLKITWQLGGFTAVLCLITVAYKRVGKHKQHANQQ